MKTIRGMVLALVAAAGTLQAGVIFSVSPVGGAVAGLQGATVGWGFTFANDTNFAVITSAEYLSGLDVGIFTDLISPQYHVIGPGAEMTSWSQDFDNTGGPGMAGLGAGRFEISSTAVPGVATGVIRVQYDLYTNDPSLDPDADPGLISGGNVVDANVSVEVLDSGSGVDTPEPGTGVLTSLLLLAGAGLKMRQRR